MEKFYRQTLKLFKDFKTYEKKLNTDFETKKASGQYSKKYLQDTARENISNIDKERATVQRRFAETKETLKSELEAKYSLDTSYLSEKLVSLLKSGIKLTSRELSALAERHSHNLTNSRLLRDYADSQGYELDCYTNYEDVVKAFDTHIDRLSKSMRTNHGELPYYVSIEEAEADGGRLCGEVARHSFECRPKPKNLAESISRDIEKDRKEADAVADANSEAFIKGFTGRKPTEVSLEDKLTESEKQDAKILSKKNGHNGVITDEEVAYIRSSDYEQIVAERETSTNISADGNIEVVKGTKVEAELTD